jgi:hypothetical protein
MGSAKFSPVLTGDSKLDRIQQNISNAFNNIVGPYLGGNLVTGISLTAGTPKKVNTGLTKTPTVWTLGDITAAATVYRVAWDASSITLQASADCTIAIWVNAA